MSRLKRVLTIHGSLLRGESPRSAREWAREFGVDQRTVLRDLALMKGELNSPVEFDLQRKGYVYRETKKPVMPEVKTSKWTRLLTLIHRITAEPGKSAQQLAEETGCSPRTIFRDVSELQKIGLPLSNHNGYRFASDAFLPVVNLTPEEMFALFVAVRLLESQDEAELGPEGRRALEKLMRRTSERRRPDLNTLRTAVQVAEVSEETGAHLLTRVQESLCQGKQVILYYRGMKDEKALPRRLDPVGLFCFRQVWYLHAFDHGREGLRNFRLSRVERLESTDRPVVHEAKMEVRQASYHRWDVEGGPPRRVVLKVAESLARWLEENPAHRSQKIEGDRVTYQVGDPVAMARWITSLYGLEVLEPVELREELERIGSELLELYGDHDDAS